jgi:ATPase complex subunit ATP10
LRKRLGVDNWGRYFLVRKGISDQIRDAVGLLNSKVGYTYLLDGECRIRWAGSGPCEGDEKEGLVRGTRRLIEEAKRKEKPTPLPQRQIREGQTQKAAAPAA